MAALDTRFVRVPVAVVLQAPDQPSHPSGIGVAMHPDGVFITTRSEDGSMVAALLSFDKLDRFADFLVDAVDAHNRQAGGRLQ